MCGNNCLLHVANTLPKLDLLGALALSQAVLWL